LEKHSLSGEKNENGFLGWQSYGRSFEAKKDKNMNKKPIKQIVWMMKMKEQGRCVTCGKPAVNKTHCELHRKAHATKQLKYWREKHGKQS